MEIRVLGFGIVKDIFGQSEIALSLSCPANVNQVKKDLEKRYPRLAQLSSYLVARNNVYAHDTTEVGMQDEIAIIPPVSGG